GLGAILLVALTICSRNCGDRGGPYFMASLTLAGIVYLLAIREFFATPRFARRVVVIGLVLAAVWHIEFLRVPSGADDDIHRYVSLTFAGHLWPYPFDLVEERTRDKYPSFKHDRPSTLQSAALCPKLQHKQTNLNLPKKEGIMTQTSATQPAGKQAADKNAIRPFQVNFPEAELTELRRRINATKWPERETVTDASQGVQLATVQARALL